MKYSKEKGRTIADMFATGDHTIADVCTKAGIAESTFYAWKAGKPEFSELLKKADEDRLAAFANMARSGLAKLLDVHEVEETTTEYVDKEGKPKVKSKKVTTRKFMPNATAVIFALKNLDAENFKDKHEVEHSGGVAVTWNETRTYAPQHGSDTEAD